MNLLLTADPVGGVWTFALDLVAALRDAAPEVRVTVATLGGPPSPGQLTELARLLPPERVFHSDARLEWMEDAWADVDRSGAWLLSLARESRADLVHLNHGLAHGALPWEVPVLLAAHSCVGSWWRAVKGEALPPTWATYQSRAGAGLRAADVVGTPSAALREELRRLYGPLRDVRVLPNGRGPRRELAPDEEKQPFILAAGRAWDEAKNLAALARVAARLPWPVEIAGDSTSPDGRPFDAPGGARLRGKLSPAALAARMGAAAIFAAPARYEPFGLAILEAALCGCALVLGDIPSLRELWDGGALFVDPTDDNALADALTRLALEPDARDHLAAAARACALTRPAARMAADYAAVYRELKARTA